MKCARDGCENPAAPYSGKGPRPIYCSRACRFKAYQSTPEGKASVKLATKKNRAKYRKAGLCVTCGRPRGERSVLFCTTHLEQRNERAKARRAALVLTAGGWR